MKKKHHTDSVDSFFNRKKSSFRLIYNTTIERILETIKKFPVPGSFEPVIVRKTYEKLFIDKNTKLRDNNDLSLSAELSCMEVCCRYVFSSVKEELSCIDAHIQQVLNKTKEKIPITDTDLGFMKTALFSGLSDKKHSASINGLFFPMTSIFGWSIPVPPPKNNIYTSIKSNIRNKLRIILSKQK